jgi:hypothetical protein
MITTILLITATLLIQSCNKPTEPAQESISVTVEDVSCTEAWLKISDTNANPDITVVVKRDDTDILTLNLNKADTVIVDEKLLPNKSYTYRAVKQQGSNVVEASKPVTAVTLDTTSHNFTWQTFEFGEHSSSVLYDVAIIDENNIWAVGEIYMKDSLGNYDHNAYNAVHWNGQKWELKKISVLFRGNIITPPLEGVFAFSGNDIWFVGSLPIHGDGNNWTMYDLRTTVNPNLSLSKAWGISSNNIYFVGNNGSIAHWDGSSWKKIESGTTTNINDIWGIMNNGLSTVFCTVSSMFNPPQDKKILKVTANHKVDSISWEMDRHVYGCWTRDKNILYVCGVGVFVNKFGIWEQINLPAIATNSIRGNNINDIIAVGSLGTIYHYNGVDWQVMSINTEKGNYKVDIKNNIVAICGCYYSGNGFVDIGIRN